MKRIAGPFRYDLGTSTRRFPRQVSSYLGFGIPTSKGHKRVAYALSKAGSGISEVFSQRGLWEGCHMLDCMRCRLPHLEYGVLKGEWGSKPAWPGLSPDCHSLDELKLMCHCCIIKYTFIHIRCHMGKVNILCPNYASEKLSPRDDLPT